MILGVVLRFKHLSLKPLWADECSTLAFSLGNSFQSLPLDQLVSMQQLLAPLQWNHSMQVTHTVQTLLSESNHPPLFFSLMHGWIGSWMVAGEAHRAVLSPLLLARSLSALFGILSIPLTYIVARKMWRASASFYTAHFAALLMALSPFSIYLAQEARHYTLTLLWILGSLVCLVRVLRCWRDRHPISIGLMVSWINLNGLGIATHYFFGLTLLAEAIVLAIGLLILNDGQQEYKPQLGHNYGRLWAIILGTIASGLVWLPFLLAIQQGDELTRWVQASQGSGWTWLAPLLNTAASLVTMLYILPIQGVTSGVAIASGLAIAIATGITLGLMKRAIAATENSNISGDRSGVTCNQVESQTQNSKTVQVWLKQYSLATDNALSLFVLGGVIVSSIAIMLLVTYVFGMDISQAFRYHFVYFPAVILLLGWGLAQCWYSGQWRSRLWIGVVILLAFLGALTVSHNLAYQKTHRPDRVVEIMAERSQPPLIVAISHQSHGQTGRLMSLASEMERQTLFANQTVSQSANQSANQAANQAVNQATDSLQRVFQDPQFFLDHQPCDRPGEQNCNAPSPMLRQTLSNQTKAYDLWLINYEGQANLTPQHCIYHKTKRVDGYKAQHYSCGRKE
ncbi:MAG: hypothetical protein AAGD25_28145 [Cyanobacteria bacterium P01_F01_bin.150]